jgi:hypothetical protein
LSYTWANIKDCPEGYECSSQARTVQIIALSQVVIWPRKVWNWESVWLIGTNSGSETKSQCSRDVHDAMRTLNLIQKWSIKHAPWTDTLTDPV